MNTFNLQDSILPHQNCFQWLAPSTRHVVFDVAPYDRLDLALLEPALYDELVVGVQLAHGAHLDGEELGKVVGLAVQPGTSMIAVIYIDALHFSFLDS